MTKFRLKEYFTTGDKCHSKCDALSLPHPVPLVGMQQPWHRVSLHTVLVLGSAPCQRHVTRAVHQSQRLILHRLAHREQQLRELGDLAT